MNGVEWFRLLCRSESLPPRARLVGATLATNCTKGDSPMCRASLRTIQQRSGYSDRGTVGEALDQLAAEGWIAVQRAARPSPKGGYSYGASTYILTVPACGQVGDNPVDSAVDNLGTTQEVVGPDYQGGREGLPPRGSQGLPQERKRILKRGADSEPLQTPDPDRRAAVLDLVSRIATNKRT